MGIKHLNKFLRNSCPHSIRPISIADLSGKRIAVDISIYLYKYEAEGLLLENMYLMLSIFRYYNVIPIFIFDGKAPAEKKELLQKRREDRTEALKEFNDLKNQLKNADDDDRQEIIASMDQLKKQIVTINRKKINRVKELIRAYGATYYDAPSEADELCSMLVLKKKVWACMSEDMDMFVYGCVRVIRYFSLVNHTAILYYTKGIMEELEMTHHEFRQVCILSGTDYNLQTKEENSKVNLYTTMKYLRKYKTEIAKGKTQLRDFYEWLLANEPKYVVDMEMLEKIYSMFDLTNNHENLKIFDEIKIINGPIIEYKMREIMQEDGFVFPSDDEKSASIVSSDNEEKEIVDISL